MRFASYIYDNKTHAGIFCNGGYYSFDDLLGEDAPDTVLKFIREYAEREMPDFLAIISEQGLKPVSEGNVKLLAPIPEPFRNVICLGKNYADHAKEVAETKLSTQDDSLIPSLPVYFAKNACPAFGDGDIIPLHEHFTKMVDYEVELAVIIGKPAYCISPEEAWNVVFGYTILNDVTARDVQMAYGQWYFGKSLDGFCPIGPHIVTRDEIQVPVELDVKCRVNGEIMQSSNTSMLIYDIPRVISELSQGMRLLPGDIIATGTPGGIGHAKNPPVYLKKGDVVECEIEKIGVLTNYMGCR